MYIDATLLGGGNNLELRGDELWDVTMGSDRERLVGTIHYSDHIPFVRESLIFLNERYMNKDVEMTYSLIPIICKLIDWL